MHTADWLCQLKTLSLMSLNSIFSQVFEHKFTFSPHKSYFGHCPYGKTSKYVLFLPPSKFMILLIIASFETMSSFQQGQNLSKTVKDSDFFNDPRKSEPEWNTFSQPVTLKTVIKLWLLMIIMPPNMHFSTYSQKHH